MKRLTKTALTLATACWILGAVQAAQTPAPNEALSRCLTVLQSKDADRKAKADACRELGVIGNKEAVKVLVPLLADPELSDMARYALEPNPAREVDQAFRDALNQLSGRQLIGLIRSVAVRKDRIAEPGLTRHLFAPEPEVAQAAARALGSLGTEKAAKTLRASMLRVPKENQVAFAEGLFRCAEQLFAKGDRSEALVSYDHLRGLVDAADAEQAARLGHVQAGATRGLIMASGKRGLPLMLVTLKEGNHRSYEGALRAALELPGSSVTRKLAETAATLPEIRQVPVIRVLGFRADAEALPVLNKLATDGAGEARLAAIAALGQIGNPKAVPVLKDLLDSTDVPASKAALEVLGGLPGNAADEAALSLLGSSAEKERSLGLQLVSRRRMASALPELFRQAREGSPAAQVAAIRQAGELAGVNDVPTLLDLLKQARSSDVIVALQYALESIGERASDKPAQARALSGNWNVYSPEQKAALLQTLGANGSSEALATTRKALAEPDEKVRSQAVRVISNWSSPEAAPDMLKLAGQTERANDRALALRGYLRLARQDDVDAQQKIAMCRHAEKLVQSPDEKRLLISAVGSAPNVEAAQMLVPYLEAPDTREEAASAIVTVGDRIVKRPEAAAEKKALVPYLEKVVQSGAGEEVKKKAQAVLELAKK